MDAVHEQERRFFSLVVPTYKESHRLGDTLQEIFPYLESRFARFEIIIVDDNSPDGTRELALNFRPGDPRIRVLTQNARIGKGAAVRRGCLEAQGEIILFMDADHATPIQEIEPFLSYSMGKEYCMIAGARTYQEDESRGRRILGLLAQLAAHLIVFEKAVVDSQCGFKLFTRAAAQALFSSGYTPGGMFDVELFFLAHRFGIPTFFVPVSWKNKAGSTINVLACLVRDPIELLRIRTRAWLGRYPNTLPTKDVDQKAA